MASHSRRTISSFSLAFLDIMFCGFGAVVLLVLIINANTLTQRDNRVSEIRAEMAQEEMERRLITVHVEQQRSEIHSIEKSIQVLQNNYTADLADLRQVEKTTISAADEQSAEDEITALQIELKALEKDTQKLSEQITIERKSGRQARAFVGTGNRQYLTGLRLTGERVLILVDSSASMLDSKIVDVIRRKVLDDKSRRAAPKWRRTVTTMEWLVANLPSASSVQIHHFNTLVTPLAAGDSTSWTPVTQFDAIDEMMARLRMVAPLGGTNLESVFLKARSLTPKPDNIILLTDGLPTRGKQEPRASTIDGAGRIKLYQRAIKNLPANVPVNTILFPMEGDPLAASLFWKLAIDSGGSFFTPTRDWP